ncbi:MAG: hypothetical protein IKA79_00510 [Lentisphaeria bacterium]|nr:hypothetical protein [Lentisphaeria bacterium]
MKKLLVIAAAAAMVFTLSACQSARTPTSGPRSKNVYYMTVLGISIESLIYGDGLLVGQK